jgi:hypothetical protein
MCIGVEKNSFLAQVFGTVMDCIVKVKVVGK